MNKVLISGIVLIVLVIIVMAVQISADFIVTDTLGRAFFGSSYFGEGGKPISELNPLIFNFDMYFALFMFVVFFIGLILLISGLVIRKRRK